MVIIAFGMPLLVLSMALVMGGPFIYYLKRDQEYAITSGLPQEKRLETWYA
jgi:hypothetical protein